MVDDPSSGPSRPLTIFLLVLCSQLVCPICSYGYLVVSGHFKPSVASGYSYRWYHREWVDYCPACGHYDCLLINPKGVPEGELTCSRCGADYCGVTGLDKGGGRWRLRRATVTGRVDMGLVAASINMSLSGMDNYFMCETVRF